MSEEGGVQKGPKKTMSQQNAIITMSAGGAALALGIFVPAEAGSALYVTKICLGVLGLVVLCVGAYYRPMKPEKTKG
jgi:hypothetical protein